MHRNLSFAKKKYIAIKSKYIFYFPFLYLKNNNNIKFTICFLYLKPLFKLLYVGTELQLNYLYIIILSNTVTKLFLIPKL